MKLINSSVEIIPQEPGLLGVYKQIELAGRTAYKSEDRITDDSAKRFVDMLLERGHTAPLESGTVYLCFPINGLFNQIDARWKKYESNPYSKVEYNCKNIYAWEAHVTTNARVIYENGWQDDLKYLCEPTEDHKKRITARFTCSRSISHELVRHRTFSFVQESTRYCNYSKDKFSNELTYIIPYWCNLPEGNVDLDYWPFKVNGVDIDPTLNKEVSFVFALRSCEEEYFYLLKKGCKPQEAREVLPNALKTEVVMTGFKSDWDAFFKLRCDSAAHPDMQKLANELKKCIES